MKGPGPHENGDTGNRILGKQHRLSFFETSPTVSVQYHEIRMEGTRFAQGDAGMRLRPPAAITPS